MPAPRPKSHFGYIHTQALPVPVDPRVRDEPLAGADEHRVRLRDDKNAGIKPGNGRRKTLRHDELRPVRRLTADGDEAPSAPTIVWVEIEVFSQDSMLTE